MCPSIPIFTPVPQWPRMKERKSRRRGHHTARPCHCHQGRTGTPVCSPSTVMDDKSSTFTLSHEFWDSFSPCYSNPPPYYVLDRLQGRAMLGTAAALSLFFPFRASFLFPMVTAPCVPYQAQWCRAPTAQHRAGARKGWVSLLLISLYLLIKY